LSAGDDSKTREELLAEIAALKAELEKRTAEAGGPTPQTSAAPILSVPLTRRESMVSWIAPVILSLPVVQGIGSLLAPGTAQAAPAPTMVGRCIVAPTAKAGSPTQAPTRAPTAVPTKPKKGVPTFSPTVSPTLGMAAAPDARPAIGGLIALGNARALCPARLAA
jgi:hypothetical protein